MLSRLNEYAYAASVESSLAARQIISFIAVLIQRMWAPRVRITASPLDVALKEFSFQVGSAAGSCRLEAAVSVTTKLKLPVNLLLDVCIS